MKPNRYTYAAALLLAGAPCVVHATVSTYATQADWLASVAPPVVVNFDELADGTPVANQYQALGITFESFNGGLLRAVSESNPHSLFQTLSVDHLPGVSCCGGVALNFSSPAAGVGFWFNDSQFAGNSVVVLDAGHNVLASYEMPYPHPTEWLFVGFTSSNRDIARVQVAMGDNDRVTFDDVMFTAAVPEPSQGLLLLGGGGLLAWMARRRRVGQSGPGPGPRDCVSARQA